MSRRFHVVAINRPSWTVGDERETERGRRMSVATDDRLLTRKQAAEVLGFQPQTLARWKWEGRADRPPEVRVGNRAVRYRASELSKWIADRGENQTRNPRN
jgi:predicted DNA-binding transcriptional regulator AlpA